MMKTSIYCLSIMWKKNELEKCETQNCHKFLEVDDVKREKGLGRPTMLVFQ